MNTLLKALELSELGEVSHATIRRLAILLIKKMRNQVDGHAALTLLSLERTA